MIIGCKGCSNILDTNLSDQRGGICGKCEAIARGIRINGESRKEAKRISFEDVAIHMRLPGEDE